MILILCVALVVATQIALTRVKAKGTEAEKNKYTDMLFRDGTINNVVKEYHEAINKIFNKRIEKLVALSKSSEKKNDYGAMMKLISPPQMETDKDGTPLRRADCQGEGASENYLSTYCLSMNAVDEYFLFREVMIIARGQARTKVVDQYESLTGKKAGDIKPNEIGFEQNPAKNLQNYGADLDRIDREIEIAQKSIDKGLAAYNEMQMALVLHNKYKKIIKSLENYRDKISDIRQEVDLYPFTFLDVTTTDCT